MTEAEWAACTDPDKILTFLRGKASDRKLRLFAVSCCRSVRDFLWTTHSYPAVLVAERYADGLAEAAELDEARNRVEFALELYGDEPVYDASYWACSREIKEYVGRCARYAVSCSTVQVDQAARDFSARCEAIAANERVVQSRLLADIFGNFVRPVALDPAWQSPTAVALATAAHEHRCLSTGTLDPERLSVLADALEEVGCSNAEILTHLRGPGPHVVGCWPVDLLLGRE